MPELRRNAFLTHPDLDATILPLRHRHRRAPRDDERDGLPARDAPRSDRRHRRHDAQGRRTARHHGQRLCQRLARPAVAADLRQSRSAQLSLHLELADFLRQRARRRSAPARRALFRERSASASSRTSATPSTPPARPFLSGAIAHFDCELAHEYQVGSHSILDRSRALVRRAPGSPLGYFNGGFHDFGIHVD